MAGASVPAVFFRAMPGGSSGSSPHNGFQQPESWGPPTREWVAGPADHFVVEALADDPAIFPAPDRHLHHGARARVRTAYATVRLLTSRQ